MDRFGLAQKTIVALRTIFKNDPRVKQVILYGSRAKGNFRTGSDIDIMLTGSELTTEDLLRFEDAIDNLYLPNKVDLSLRHHIDNKNLLDHVDRVGVDLRSPPQRR